MELKERLREIMDYQYERWERGNKGEKEKQVCVEKQLAAVKDEGFVMSFTAESYEGEGIQWVGYYLTRVKEYDMPPPEMFFVRPDFD